SVAATTTYTWSDGLLQSTTDADENTTVYIYNGLHQVTSQVTADISDTIADDEVFAYDGAGYRSSTTVGVGAADPVTTYTTYDGKGQLLLEINPAGDTSLFTYAAAGDMRTSTDSRGVQTVIVFNGADEPIREIVDANQPVPEPSTESFDGAGNETLSVDADG